jgi:uncharacterized protein
MTIWSATPADVDTVTRLLGRIPEGPFRVVVRRHGRDPVVIENAPHLNDGTPMPTLYWLLDPEVRDAVSRVEAAGGVKRYQEILDPDLIQAAHDAYRIRRESLVERTELPQPSGGVGGTRQGLKCLHAHVAYFLAGGDDAVGRMVADEVADALTGVALVADVPVTGF